MDGPEGQSYLERQDAWIGALAEFGKSVYPNKYQGLLARNVQAVDAVVLASALRRAREHIISVCCFNQKAPACTLDTLKPLPHRFRFDGAVVAACRRARLWLRSRP